VGPMGLRLVAHYYDRVEALIAFSAIDAAGVPVFLESSALLAVDIGYIGAVGGYRVVVCEPDLAAAVAVLDEARAAPILEGEVLDVEHDALNGVLSLIVGLLAAAPAPIRGRRWRAA
jgi:hypothetical protein